MAKTDLSEAYIRVWLSFKDVPNLAFVVPVVRGETNILIGFHLSLLMEFVDSWPHFYVVTETSADMVSNADLTVQSLHPLVLLADTTPPTDHACYIAAETMATEDTHLEELFL